MLLWLNAAVRQPQKSVPPYCTEGKFFSSAVYFGSRRSSLSLLWNVFEASAFPLSCQSSQDKATRVNSPPRG